MRLVFMDEAGLSNPQQEPFVVVVGALVRNPVQRGRRFQRKADSNPVIADSR